MNRKLPEEIELMRKAGKILIDAMCYAKPFIKPGISTYELDKLIEKFIIDCGGSPSCLGYEGYPACSCISVNEMVVHGIPSKDIILKEGDIVSIDLVVGYKGFNADATRTFPVGIISEEKRRLVEVTRQSFYEGIKHLKVGQKIGKVSHAIQQFVEKNGYSVVRELCGHGIGKKMHEQPNIPNYGREGDGPVVVEGATLAIEPMVNMGRKEIGMMKDGWGIVTRDGLPAAHYENTVLVKADGIEILTLGCDD